MIAQLGVSMLVDHNDFSTAWSKLDKTNIAVAGALGAATGFIDGGTSALVKFVAKPSNRKLLEKVIPIMVDFLVETIEGVEKNVLNGEELDIHGAAAGAFTEIGFKQLAGFFKTSKKLSKKLERLESNTKIDMKKAQKQIDKGNTKAKYDKRVKAGKKKLGAIEQTRAFMDIPKSAAAEAGSNVEIKDGTIVRQK